MMTKKQFCECIASQECEYVGCNRKEAHNFIYQSGSLAVALEFLGELSESEKKYSSTRGAPMFTYVETDENGKFKECHMLGIREIVKLLPD